MRAPLALLLLLVGCAPNTVSVRREGETVKGGVLSYPLALVEPNDLVVDSQHAYDVGIMTRATRLCDGPAHVVREWDDRSQEIGGISHFAEFVCGPAPRHKHWGEDPEGVHPKVDKF